MDVIEQLVGEMTGWDPVDTLVFVAYGCSKFGGQSVNIDLGRSVMEVLSEDGATVTQRFEIEVTLKP